MEFSKDKLSFRFFTVLQHPLNDTASIRMCSETVDLALESIDDELDVLRRDSFDSFLDNMVAILVSHTLKNMMFKFFNHGCLLVSQDMFQCLSRISWV